MMFRALLSLSNYRMLFNARLVLLHQQRAYHLSNTVIVSVRLVQFVKIFSFLFDTLRIFDGMLSCLEERSAA